MIVSIHRWTRVSSFHEFITPFPFQTTKQHFSRPSSSNIRKKKKKNILSLKFKLENLRKKSWNVSKEKYCFPRSGANNLQFERWTLRSGNETIVGPRFRLSCAFFAPATMQDSSNFAAKCPIVSRFIKWNLKRPHCERQSLILNDTPAQRRRSPDRGNESNLLNIASDDDKRHGYGMQDFVDSRNGENT